MKNSTDTIGYRTRDLAACGALPHPTVLPPAPVCTYIILNYGPIANKQIALKGTQTLFLHVYRRDYPLKFIISRACAAHKCKYGCVRSVLKGNILVVRSASSCLGYSSGMSRSPRKQHIPCKYGCDRSIMKGTLLGEHCASLSVSGTPHPNSVAFTTHALQTA